MCDKEDETNTGIDEFKCLDTELSGLKVINTLTIRLALDLSTLNRVLLLLSGNCSASRFGPLGASAKVLSSKRCLKKH